MKRAVIFIGVWIGGLMFAKATVFEMLIGATKDANSIALLAFLTIFVWTVASLIVAGFSK